MRGRLKGIWGLCLLAVLTAVYAFHPARCYPCIANRIGHLSRSMTLQSSKPDMDDNSTGERRRGRAKRSSRKSGKKSPDEIDGFVSNDDLPHDEVAVDDSGRPVRVAPPPAPTPLTTQTAFTSSPPSISTTRETRRKQRRGRNSKEGPIEWIQSKVQEYLAPTPVGETPKILELVKSITWTGVAILVVLELFAAFKFSSSLPFDAQRSLPPPDLRSISPTE
eukprot:scaffold1290_cov248-Ochromonas_danica.AAC.6